MRCAFSLPSKRYSPRIGKMYGSGNHPFKKVSERFEHKPSHILLYFYVLLYNKKIILSALLCLYSSNDFTLKFLLHNVLSLLPNPQFLLVSGNNEFSTFFMRPSMHIFALIVPGLFSFSTRPTCKCLLRDINARAVANPTIPPPTTIIWTGFILVGVNYVFPKQTNKIIIILTFNIIVNIIC
ncbi:hypothetical protein AGLY_001308 [Aphis glycines]|uniref:Uncharacterized protein n=1 Tax=Aphis glycines TaxID=307491 RepID=A0A6G0U9F6_APHGL|nr:hypothetical protein AGLY_001308 [Aphis glycines]